MRLVDIMVPIKPTDQLTEADILEDNKEIMCLNMADIEALSPQILVKNSTGAEVGKIYRDVLAVLRKACNSWMLEKILDQCQEGVVAIDADGRIFYVNDAYTRILGIAKGNVLGKSMQKVEPGAVMLKVLESGEPILDKTVNIKTLERDVKVNVFPILLNNNLVSIVSFFRDVTEAKRLSQALNRAQGLADYFRQQLEQQGELINEGIVGKNPRFTKALSQAMIVAKTEAGVLLLGENGVGKEIFAKLIHANSSRAEKPLITINCAAIPENLLESELFGYEEGSFTGARRGGKIGKFELADGGTIFLDEVGDMSGPMQAKLLRVLQEREIEKVGKTKNIHVDVRVIAATNQPLEKMVERGTFRNDLFYRLHVVAIRIPPLRERGDDIALLACHFLRNHNKQYNKNLALSPEVLRFLYEYEWPGNVRELQNCIEYATIMCLENEIQLEHLPPNMTEGRVEVFDKRQAKSKIGTLHDEVSVTERDLIQKALQACSNRSEAMKILGVSRRTFYRKLKEHNMMSDNK